MTTSKDVLIAVYLIPDLAKKDFDAVLKLAEDKTITVEGVALVHKDADGEVHVQETGDHLGRKGAQARRRRRPRRRPLRAAAPGRDGRRRGRSAAARGQVRASTGSRAGSARRWTPRCPPGSGGIIAIYDTERRRRRRQGARQRRQEVGRPHRRRERRRSSRPDWPKLKPAWAAEPDPDRGASGTRARCARLREVRSQPSS